MKSFVKFTPIAVLAFLIIGVPEKLFGMNMPFSFEGLDVLIAAPLATIYAMCIAYITEKISIKAMIKAATDNIQEMQLVFFILMFAYAMADAFMETGVGASIVNIALKLGVNARFVAPVGLLVTALLSIATGTSWGTFAACAPVFLWLNNIVGGNVLLTTAAIAGGSCFGDNIGLISDTTVVSSGIQKVEIIDRIRYQGVWSGVCLFAAVILTFIIGLFMGLPGNVAEVQTAISAIPPEAYAALEEQRPAAVSLLNQVASGVPIYMAIPLILVIAMAVAGIQTLICLAVGIISSGLLGYFAGTVEGLSTFLNLIYGGFKSAGSWVIIMMMWVGAFSGIMSHINAFQPLSYFIEKRSKSVRGLMTRNAVLCLFGNAMLSDEMAQIVTIGPIIEDLTARNVVCKNKEDEYRLRLRNATFSDAMGVFGSQLIPWHVYILFYVSIASAVYPLHTFKPLDIITFNMMSWIAVLSMVLLTATGFDRFIPMFSMPHEPEVYLKKNADKYEEILENPKESKEILTN